MKSSLKRVVAALEKMHAPEPLVAKSAFEVVLWENVAYLVDDDRRKRAFEVLRERVGLTPEAIDGAKKGVLEGLVGDECAEKLRRAAEVALEIEDLDSAVASNSREARRTLKRFPGIGDPGADRILMLFGGARTIAPESNGLRVLCRLGLVEEQKGYAATYRKAVEALEAQLPRDPARAHALLREHGRVVCRRSAPHCEVCPLTKTCAFYQATAGRAAKDRV
jgi:endonuclease III